MAYSSQVTNVEAVSDMTGLVHQIFVGQVQEQVAWESITAQLFMAAESGPDYRYDGSKMVGAADLRRPTGALGTSGALPDHAHFDAVNWETTPVRRYRRIAVDNFTEARAKGPGAFEDFGVRIFDQLWGAWSLMEILHAVGGSDGVLCKVSARGSSTTFTAKDGVGHAGQSPLIFMDEGEVIAWVDTSAGNALAGAGTISALNQSTLLVTVTTAATWEPGANLGANDLIVKATTPNISTDYFQSEYNNAKNGSLDIIDPDADATTVFNISETTYPRWKPYRTTSSTWDHIEITEFFRKLAAKSTAPVTADSHTAVLQGGPFAELARTLVGFQQQQQLGKTLEGGYETIRVANMDFAIDDYQLSDVMYLYCTEDLYTVNLLEAGMFDEDGSQWSRLSDYDGKEANVRDYCNTFSPRRNRHGALTSITLANVTATDFDPTPNY